jgi:signal transduction histidine kinase
LETSKDSEGNDRDGAAWGARRALSCVGHELSSPLTALYTYLKLAASGRGEDALRQARACADRVQAVTSAIQELSRVGGAPALVDVGAAVERAAARVPGGARVDFAGRDPAPAWIAPSAGDFVIAAVLRAVASGVDAPAALRARIVGRGGRVELRVSVDAEPERWAAIEPWSDQRTGLDLWLAAIVAAEAGGAVRSGDVDGRCAVALELPAREARP